MTRDAVIRDAVLYAKEIFRDDTSGHDYFHTMRVYETATKIAEKEGAEIFTVQLLALLHDVDDRKLSPWTTRNKDRAVQFLLKHDMSDRVDEFCRMLRELSYQGADSVVPSTLEGMCVQDADRLDAMGAIGIARAFAYGGAHGRVLFDPAVRPRKHVSGKEYVENTSGHTINHFYEKLLRLKDMMNTETARTMAVARDTYMRAYLKEFFAEWSGEL